MSARARTSRSSMWQHAGAWLLVLALLWAQALGLAHRVLHAGGAPVAVVDAGHAAPAGLLGHLLGGKSGDAECRLYDQLAHGDAVPLPPVVALPALPPALLAVVEPTLVCVLARAAFAARAPPAVR